MINNILIINGIYDIISALLLLFNHSLSIHLNMFINKNNKNNKIIQRFFAYWIFTYGIIRLITGIYNIKILYLIGSLTYFIEALCFKYENIIGNTMDNDKVNFVVILSSIFGLLIIYQI
jgi:hypothetical protein